MNKTFTMIVATVALAGLAFAEIATDPAGYIEKETAGAQILVCNPFVPFSASAKLASIDGSNIGNGGSIGVVTASTGAIRRFYWREDGHWYTEKEQGGELADGVELARGDAIVFDAASGYPLLLSGVWSDEEVAAKTAVVGYNLVGNASISPKKLKDFIPTGTDYNRDYVSLNGTRYIFKNNHWYVKDTGSLADNVDVYSGDGLFLFCPKRPRGTLSAQISIPDDSQ